MNSRSTLARVQALICATALAVTAVGCSAPDNTSKQAEQASSSAQPLQTPTAHDQADPKADGRIDVTTTGNQVATFRGATYIVSDATISQNTGDGLTEGLGLQEICVVNQPEEWQEIDSLGWDRNSISYTGISMPWGKASYRYEYANEASAVEGTQEWSRTDVSVYFAGLGDVKETEVNGHKISYLFDEAAANAGMEDLEAQAMGVESAPGRSVSVYTFEQRGDKCSFLTNVNCSIQDESATLDPEQIIKDVYAPLSFVGKDEKVDAASYLSDVEITSANNDHTVVLARKGDALASYSQHSVTMMGDSKSDFFSALTTYDYAPQSAAPEGAEEHTLGDRTFRVAVTENQWTYGEESGADYKLEAWTDVEGEPLRIEAAKGAEEDVETVLQRVVDGRIISAS